MKNRGITVILALLLIMIVTAGSGFASDKTVYLLDEASIVSPDNQRKINSRLADISREQSCGVYLMTTDDFMV